MTVAIFVCSDVIPSAPEIIALSFELYLKDIYYRGILWRSDKDSAVRVKRRGLNTDLGRFGKMKNAAAPRHPHRSKPGWAQGSKVRVKDGFMVTLWRRMIIVSWSWISESAPELLDP